MVHLVFMSAFMPGNGAEVSDWRSRATIRFDGTFSHYDPGWGTEVVLCSTRTWR